MRPWHIVVVVFVILLLFGIPKLPELARAIGRSLRILKSETKDLMSDDAKRDVQGKAEAQTGGPDLGAPNDSPAPQPPLAGDVITPKNQRDER